MSKRAATPVWALTTVGTALCLAVVALASACVDFSPEVGGYVYHQTACGTADAGPDARAADPDATCGTEVVNY